MVQEPWSGRGQLDRGMHVARCRFQGGCKILQNTGKVQEPGGVSAWKWGHLDRGMGWSRGWSLEEK